MKNLMNTSLALMAISVSGCTTPAKANPQGGRIIEFKSGPEGFDTRTFFYEGETEVVAFDAQFTPALAEASIKKLREFTNKPISWLVITHPNPDKFNGSSVFKAEGAKVIASAATASAIPGTHAYKEYFFVQVAKMFKPGEYPQPVPVDQTFTGETSLVLRGGERIQLKELSHPGVSSTQTVAYLDSANTLIVGDLVHYKAHAWLEGGIVNGKPVPTIEGWIADLKELGSLYPQDAKVLGGRGITADLKTVVRVQSTYLQRAVKLVRSDLKDLGPKANDFNGPNSSTMYKELAARFQTVFPGYDLSYMIEYGAYGLVQQEMQKK
jgi:glyoxylase-like metal-dependent hydrolase (beta-lactamase superfamily II)